MVVGGEAPRDLGSGAVTHPDDSQTQAVWREQRWRGFGRTAHLLSMSTEDETAIIRRDLP